MTIDLPNRRLKILSVGTEMGTIALSQIWMSRTEGWDFRRINRLNAAVKNPALSRKNVAYRVSH
jgi:hypothetical protein